MPTAKTSSFFPATNMHDCTHVSVLSCHETRLPIRGEYAPALARGARAAPALAQTASGRHPGLVPRSKVWRPPYVSVVGAECLKLTCPHIPVAAIQGLQRLLAAIQLRDAFRRPFPGRLVGQAAPLYNLRVNDRLLAAGAVTYLHQLETLDKFPCWVMFYRSEGSETNYPPPFISVPGLVDDGIFGLRKEHVQYDLLHTLDLGVAAVMAGTILHEFLKPADVLRTGVAGAPQVEKPMFRSVLGRGDMRLTRAREPRTGKHQLMQDGFRPPARSAAKAHARTHNRPPARSGPVPFGPRLPPAHRQPALTPARLLARPHVNPPARLRARARLHSPARMLLGKISRRRHNFADKFRATHMACRS